MARITPLPKNLQYLRPFQEFLAKLPKAEVGDTTDATLLEKILRERIRGMTVDEAQKKFNTDLEELENHLSTPSRRNDRLHFVVGFLLIAVEKPEEFLKPPVARKKIMEHLTMELPTGAKSSVDQYSLMANWKRQRFYAGWLNLEEDFARKQILKQLSETEPRLDGRPATKVQFGKVVGNKSIASDDFPIVRKRADYLLKIPGGYATIVIQANHLFDESEWEPYLATLRFAIPEST